MATFENRSIPAYKLIVIDQEGTIRYKTYEKFDLVGFQNDAIMIIKNK
jgi:hypothetical protein